MAFLTRGLKIILKDKREEKQEKTFYYEGGIKEFVEYLNKSKEALYTDVIYCEGIKNNVSVEVALQHNDSYTENIYSFVNNINTPEGGCTGKAIAVRSKPVCIRFTADSRPVVVTWHSFAKSLSGIYPLACIPYSLL